MDREVYCLLGVPVDAISVHETLSVLARSVRERRRCFLSTVNLNFLALARRYPEFHRSLIDSDLCTADGVGVMTLARLNGVHLPERVSGADLLDELRSRPLVKGRQTSIFLFGGQEGVAEIACRMLDGSEGAECAGYRFPGFGDVAEMSDAGTIETINASGADAVIVSLGARKGQAWIMANLHRLDAPVVSHLGAALNFVAGTVKRAPRLMQRLGLEWAWRIWAEPYLWSRYAGDAALVGRTVSATAAVRFRRGAQLSGPLQVDSGASEDGVRLTLRGACGAQDVAKARDVFRAALIGDGAVFLEFADGAAPDCRFLGLIQMFEKELRIRGRELNVISESRNTIDHFKLHGAEYLLPKGERC